MNHFSRISTLRTLRGFRASVIVLLLLAGIFSFSNAEERPKWHKDVEAGERLFAEGRFHEASAMFHACAISAEKGCAQRTYFHMRAAESECHCHPTQAIDQYLLAAENNKDAPGASDSLFIAARLLYQSGRLEEAAAKFESFTELYPADQRLREAAGHAALCYEKSGHRLKAIQLFDKYKSAPAIRAGNIE